MNATALSSGLTCIFFIFLILGFLFGLWRGFSKSVTRILIVIAIAVLSFFVVPSISKSLLTTNLSSLGISVNGVPLLNIEQFIKDLLSSFDKIDELINASPTFASFIQVLPEILLNVVLFILFFVIAKLASMVIYWILCAILFPKKKNEGKNKHRFLGAIVGTVQGLIVALVVFMPLFGIINLSTQAQLAYQESQTELNNAIAPANNQNPQTLNGYIFTTNDNSPEDNDESTTQNTVDIEEVLKYSKALENNGIYKFLNGIGFIGLSNNVFDHLTTVKIDETKYSLTTESIGLSKMYPYLDLVVKANDFDITDNDFINKLIMLIDASKSSIFA